jgi:signal transduction histidine kinase
VYRKSSIKPNKVLLVILLVGLALSSSALSVKDSLIKIYTTQYEPKAKAEAALQLANIYTNRTIYDSSEFYLKNAYLESVNIEDERIIMNCYMQYGILESYKGNYTLAANYLLRTLIYADKNKDKFILSAVYVNLASVYSALEEYKKAKFYLLKIDQEELRNNQLLLINYLGNLGQLEYELKNYENALSYLLRGISLFGKNSQDLNLVQFYIIAGDCAYELNKESEALEYYSKANLLIDKNTLPLHYAHLTHGLARLFKNTKTKLALDYVNTSMQYAKQHQIQDLVVDNYLLQSEISQKMGNLTEALAYYKRYHAAKDSLKLYEVNNNIDKLESNYELVKSKSYIEKLQLINEKNIFKNITYLIIVIVTALTSILLFFSLKNRNKINKELKNANIVKDKLLSILSHDLKSPLKNVVGVLDGIVKDDFSKEELEIIINSINNQTLATLDTLDNILHWGKAQLRGIYVNKVKVDVNVLINEIVQLHKSQLVNKKITIEFINDNNLNVQFDQAHFEFIIRNLVSNAIKFSYQNSVIEILVEDKSNPGYTTIQVKDKGIGIQSNDYNSIFSSLPPIRTGTSNEKGTGLALSLCKEFADMNKAIIGYKPNTNAGSIFFIAVEN